MEAVERLSRELRVLFHDYWRPQVEEKGKLKADKIKFQRFKNTLNMMKRADQMLQRSQEKKQSQIPLRLSLPILDLSSQEDDQDLFEKWAGLLASTIVGAKVLASYPKILAELTPVEAKMLDTVYKWHADCPIQLSAWETKKYNSATLKAQQNLTDEEFQVCAENLMRLGLWKAVSFDSFGEVIGERGSRDLGIAHIGLTALGFGFLRACYGPMKTDQRPRITASRRA